MLMMKNLGDDAGVTGGNGTVQVDVHQEDDPDNYPLGEDTIGANEEVEAEDDEDDGDEEDDDEDDDIDYQDPEFQQIMTAAQVRVKQVDLFTFWSCSCQAGNKT